MARYRFPDPSADTRDINRGNRFQREDDRRRRDAVAVSLGGRPGMSSADQNALAGGSALSNTAPDATAPRMRLPNPVLNEDAARAVTSSRVPVGDQSQANADAARAASPTAFTPERNPAPLNLAPQKITSGGAAAVDAALAKNLALTQPGGGRGLLNPTAPTERAAAPMIAQASPKPIGKVLPDSVGDALFGERPVVGSTEYGTASVRHAAPGETTAPAVVTSEGVTRAAPLSHAEMDAQLRTKHPELYVAGSAQNQAFLDHAKRYGVDDAYKNADSLMATVANSRPTSTTPQAVKNDIGGAPSAETLAKLDEDIARSEPSIAKQAGRTGRTGLQTVINAANAVGDAPLRAGRAIAKGFSDFKQGFSGNASPAQVAPIAPTRLPNPVTSAPPVTPSPMETDEEKRKRLKNPAAI